MRTRAFVVGAASGVLLAVGGPAASGVPTAVAAAPRTNVLTEDPDTEVQQSVLALINAKRAEHGCADLILDDQLIEVARDHAAEMAGHGYFAHTSLDGADAGDRVQAVGYDWRGYAENIARGQGNPEEVVDDWMDSRPHRENILDCDLREVGLGLAFDRDHEPYWVQDFATPQTSG